MAPHWARLCDLLSESSLPVLTLGASGVLMWWVAQEITAAIV